MRTDEHNQNLKNDISSKIYIKFYDAIIIVCILQFFYSSTMDSEPLFVNFRKH